MSARPIRSKTYDFDNNIPALLSTDTSYRGARGLSRSRQSPISGKDAAR